MGLRTLKLHIAGAGGTARKKGARRFLVLWEQASTGSLSPCSLCHGKRAGSRVNLLSVSSSFAFEEMRC